MLDEWHDVTFHTSLHRTVLNQSDVCDPFRNVILGP
jgi:hypothetical protein